MRDMQFLPPPKNTDQKRISEHVESPSETLPKPIFNSTASNDSQNNKLTIKRKRSGFFIASIVGLVLAAISAIIAGIWYVQALEPVGGDMEPVRVIIEEGDGVGTVASKLYDAKLISSPLAFRIHGEITGSATRLQTGGFMISPTESIPEIMAHMANSKSDEFDVTIVPGLTTEAIVDALTDQGFSSSSVQIALERSYDHPLVQQIPITSDGLQGYIFPDTYRVPADGDPTDVLERSFDEFWRLIEEGDFETRAKKQGLTLHEAITLASIIELEVTTEQDQRQVAQVFLSRLDKDMPLGSDPTFKYAADRDGVQPRLGYDSPYNTRLNKGIPPGPIANFKITALEAVVNPASGNYLYFVSGDDGTTHFSKTLEEHERNIDRYCTTLCE